MTQHLQTYFLHLIEEPDQPGHPEKPDQTEDPNEHQDPHHLPRFRSTVVTVVVEILPQQQQHTHKTKYRIQGLKGIKDELYTQGEVLPNRT